MSSRFVSSGAIDSQTGDAVPITEMSSASAATKSSASASASTSSPFPPSSNNQTAKSTKRSEEWAAVQAQMEAERRAKREHGADASAGGGNKSLYDVLQANKAAKQAAFEEANRIKNQFRALDDDEIEFLDGVSARRREEEERARREVEEGLEGFRRARMLEHQAAHGGDGRAGEGAGEEKVQWAVAPGRKRRRKGDEREGPLVKGVKRRVGSSSGAGDGGGGDGAAQASAAEGGAEDGAGKDGDGAQASAATAPAAPAAAAAAAAAAATKAKKVGLVDYGSDEDSD